MKSLAPPHLVHFRLSPYSEKVRWALDFKRLPHTREALVPGFHRPRARRLTGRDELPVLVVDDEPATGSSAIVAAIDRLAPDPPLAPEDPAARERGAALEDLFDRQITPDTRRLFWSTYVPRPLACARMATDGFSPATRTLWLATFPVMSPLLRRNLGIDGERVRRAHERLRGAFDRIEAELRPSGYLAADRFTSVDLAVAAAMTFIVRPREFPYPPPEPWPEELVELRESVADHVGFRWVLDMYARHRSPSCEIPRDRERRDRPTGASASASRDVGAT